MNDAKSTIILLACCCIILTTAPSASADFVGVTTVIKDDPDTDFQCTQGNGAFVPGPLTVCNVYAKFDDPTDRLLSVGNADLQVYNGAKPDVFFQHPLGSRYPPPCLDIPDSPDLICDSFVAFGPKCYYDSWEFSTDGDFDASKFAFNGHIVGGWHSVDPDNGQGDAGTWPDLQVLFLQSSVAQGLSLSGDIDVFWKDDATGDIFAEQDLPIECVAVGGCQDPEDCDDGNACTEDSCDSGSCVNIPNDALCDDGVRCTVDVCNAASGCENTPENANCDDGNSCTTDTCDADVGCLNQNVDCDDGNECTDDGCDPNIGCVHLPNDNICDDGNKCTFNDHCGEDGCVHGTPVQCPKGQVCDPAIGECVEGDDPCECVNGKVTLCHIPPGNPANTRTIRVGCAARDKHLAHGDFCGPCVDGAG